MAYEDCAHLDRIPWIAGDPPTSAVMASGRKYTSQRFQIRNETKFNAAEVNFHILTSLPEATKLPTDLVSRLLLKVIYREETFSGMFLSSNLARSGANRKREVSEFGIRKHRAAAPELARDESEVTFIGLTEAD